MQCPRRAENGGMSIPGLPTEDEYRDSDHTCTYCGSYNPDMLMERLRNGDVEITPTDKSYKIYLDNKGGEPFLQTHRTDSKPFKGWNSPEHDWVTKETSMGKFYFQHLSEEQMREFIDLLNAKKLHIGLPGYFYVKPFFIV